jgi:hypothetical protein
MPFGDTPKLTRRSLCLSCTMATIVKGEAASQQIIRCNQLDQVIRFHVTDCSVYTPKNQQTLSQMLQTAWLVTSDAQGQIGFIRSKDVRNGTHTELKDEMDEIRYNYPRGR